MRYYCAAQSVIRQAADTFVAGRFGDSEVWRGADFVAQQTMLLCATKGWVVAQGGWRGLQACRKEVHTSCLRSAHLLGEKFTSLDGRGHTAFPNAHLNGIYNPKRRFFDPVTFEIKYPFVQLK
jgi:hypothetical protein